MGKIQSFTPTGSGAKVVVTLPEGWEIQAGESLAVNGVCLTATKDGKGSFSADLSAETLRVSHPSLWKPGIWVNLEHPLKVGEPLGGHWVQGHVDGVGQILSIQGNKDKTLKIRFPSSLGPYIVPKGSIAINGISLTIVTVADHIFTVTIIPYTWQVTNLSFSRAGTWVHLEGDILAKYVEKFLKR